MTRTYEHSIYEFMEKGKITDIYSIREYSKFLEFARVFYPSVYDDLAEYEYFSAYHY